jgi:hypothetical protein
MVAPISPNEVEQMPEKAFPDFVLEAFNDVIQRNYRNGRAHFAFDEVVKEIVKRSPKRLTKDQVYAKNYLDVEQVYRKQGWRVESDSPGFNESGTSTFTFSK